MAKAAAYYEEAARSGHRDAPYWLGAIGGRRYELAAERGNHKAQSRLARMYRAGEGVERGPRGRRFLEHGGGLPLRPAATLAAKRGHAEAQYRLARTLREDEAATWMREAAAGHEGANSALGRC